MIDEDADLRSKLAALGPDALRELQEVLTWPEPRRDALLRSLVGRPEQARGGRGALAAETAEPASSRRLRQQVALFGVVVRTEKLIDQRGNRIEGVRQVRCRDIAIDEVERAAPRTGDDRSVVQD